MEDDTTKRYPRTMHEAFNCDGDPISGVCVTLLHPCLFFSISLLRGAGHTEGLCSLSSAHTGHQLTRSDDWRVEGETGTVHMKQCWCSNLQGDNGANPLHNPSLKTKKPLMKPRWKNPILWIRLPQRGRDFINDSQHWLPHLAVIAVYHHIFRNVKRFFATF